LSAFTSPAFRRLTASVSRTRRIRDNVLTFRCRLLVYVVSVLFAVSGRPAGSAWGEPPRFVAIAPGIEHTAFDLRPQGEAEPFSGHVFRIDLDVADLHLVSAGGPSSRRRVEQITAPYRAVVAVNASFFDTDGRAMGLVVDEGRAISKARRATWGAFAVAGKKAQIVLGADLPNPLAYRLVVQGLPRLVVAGNIPRLKPQIAERTAVCAEGNVVVIVVATRVETTTFARFIADRREAGGLGCRDALNLDGGPSTQLVVRLPALTLSMPGGWDVPNALVVTPGR